MKWDSNFVFGGEGGDEPKMPPSRSSVANDQRILATASAGVADGYRVSCQRPPNQRSGHHPQVTELGRTRPVEALSRTRQADFAHAARLKDATVHVPERLGRLQDGLVVVLLVVRLDVTGVRVREEDCR